MSKRALTSFSLLEERANSNRIKKLAEEVQKATEKLKAVNRRNLSVFSWKIESNSTRKVQKAQKSGDWKLD